MKLGILLSLLALPAIADTFVTDADLTGAYKTRSYSSRVSCHDPSIFIDSITNGTPANPQYYIYGSHLGRGKTSATKNYQSWTTFRAGEESSGTTNSLFADTTGKLVNYANAYSTQAVTRIRNCKGEEVDFPNFDAHAWQNSGYAVKGNQWAADVIWNRKMQRWCMYMSVNGDKWCSSIVCLTSTSPEGPWVYQGPVVMSGFNGKTAHNGYGASQDYKHTDLELALGPLTSLPARYNPSFNYGQVWPNCIDPCVFYDEEGQLWMSYGSWSGGIFILRLNEANGLRDYEYTFPYQVNGSTVTPGSASQSCTSDPYFGKKIAGGWYVSGEASYIEYINGYYYLFMSYGGLEAAGGYQMRVFRSEKPDGPYRDCLTMAGANAIYSSYLLNFGHDAKIDRGVKVLGQYQWDAMPGAELAQGHNSATVDHLGRALLVYHSRFSNGGEGHQVRVHQMFQNQDGWLVVAPYEFDGETVTHRQATTQQFFSAQQVAGDYQLLAFPYRQDTKAKSYETPVNLTLVPDGSVTGTYTGSWSLVEGTSFIDLTLSGPHTNNKAVTFRGVVAEQTIDYTDIKALCFTALSSSNGQSTASGSSLQTRALSIWGSKADARAALKFSLDRMTWPVSEGQTVRRHLTLPAAGLLGTRIEWTTSDTTLIAADGTLVGTGDVTLTAILRKDSLCYERVFHVTADVSGLGEDPIYYPQSAQKNTTSGWWQNFSDYYPLPLGESARFRFRNHSNKAANYKNWALYGTNGHRDTSGYTEYFGVRCDAWNNISKSNANIESDFNWDTFTTDMNNSEVDMTVSYIGGRVSMTSQITTAAGKVYHLSYKHPTALTLAELTLFFVSEGSYITSEGLAIESVRNDAAAPATSYDLLGRRLANLGSGDAVRPGLYIRSGRLILTR